MTIPNTDELLAERIRDVGELNWLVDKLKMALWVHGVHASSCAMQEPREEGDKGNPALRPCDCGYVEATNLTVDDCPTGESKPKPS